MRREVTIMQIFLNKRKIRLKKGESQGNEENDECRMTNGGRGWKVGSGGW